MTLPVLTSARVLSVSTRALDDARRAGDALAQAVADRRALAPAPGGLAALDEAECLQLLATRSASRSTTSTSRPGQGGASSSPAVRASCRPLRPRG